MDKTVYIVASTDAMDGEVFRLDHNRLHQLPFHIDGFFQPLKEWIAIVALQSFAVLILGALALSCVSAWLKRPSGYSFGHDTVILAPLVRRSLARIFDLTLILGPLTGRALWCFVMTSSSEMADYAQDFNAPSITSLFLPSIIWAVITWSVCVISTGLWGTTPGKWLFSVRVVRSTLRPCGVLQALLRELLVWIDSPQLVWPMPGIVCQLMTEHRQRIGDLVAGTIVIQLSKPASPLRGVSWRRPI